MSMDYIVGIVICIVALVLGLLANNWMNKRQIQISRWIFGFAAFLIIFIPVALFDEISLPILYSLFIIGGASAVVFFDKSRQLLEKNQYPGMVNLKHKKSDKK